jgi:hypothetical protein
MVATGAFLEVLRGSLVRAGVVPRILGGGIVLVRMGTVIVQCVLDMLALDQRALPKKVRKISRHE